MKFKILILGIACFLMQVSSYSYAKRYSYSYHPKTYKYKISNGRTHSVRSYFKKNGSFILKHRAANPRSGVHCRKNICF